MVEWNMTTVLLAIIAALLSAIFFKLNDIENRLEAIARLLLPDHLK